MLRKMLLALVAISAMGAGLGAASTAKAEHDCYRGGYYGGHRHHGYHGGYYGGRHGYSYDYGGPVVVRSYHPGYYSPYYGGYGYGDYGYGGYGYGGHGYGRGYSRSGVAISIGF